MTYRWGVVEQHPFTLPPELEDMCHPSEMLNETCIVCDADEAWWFVERVDAWGERIWGGYVCSTTCLRKVPAQAKREIAQAYQDGRRRGSG